MATIQWRPEVNALTTPQSYWIRFVPRNVVDSEELAKRMEKAQPNYSEEEFRSFLSLRNEIIQEALINGEQVTEENAFIHNLSFTGRLDEPDDPLPDINECLQVRVRASPTLTDAVRRAARTERLPMNKKLPLINAAEDTLLKLDNVLNPQSVLQLTGNNLLFDPEGGSGKCVIKGTRNDRVVQTRFPSISNTMVMVMPEIPVQTDPWNNEYTISVSTYYSEHGTLRTGTYGRMLRTPLAVESFGEETGILTGKAASPNVSIIGGAAASPENLRIRAVLDLREDILLFALIGLRAGDDAG
ncbi:MAG: hypothetical protein D3916_16740, partial [Candidatus Electrothrix sp. MAN1_4]|nr:hypothetical protein [Candidatus Electrothrix sp. MAN1_4]